MPPETIRVTKYLTCLCSFPVKKSEQCSNHTGYPSRRTHIRTDPRLPTSSVFYQGLRSNRIYYSLVITHLCHPEARWIHPKTTITSYCSTCTLYGQKTSIQRLQHLVVEAPIMSQYLNLIWHPCFVVSMCCNLFPHICCGSYILPSCLG